LTTDGLQKEEGRSKKAESRKIRTGGSHFCLLPFHLLPSTSCLPPPAFHLLPSTSCLPQSGIALARAGAVSYRPARVDDSQLNQYVPVLLLGLVAVLFAFGTLGLSVLLGWRGRRSKIKDTAYECGMLPVGEGSTRMSLKFYLVAMLFILFDIEVVFLYPWAVVYRDMLKDPATRDLILASMVSFLAVLFIGYFYALKKKAFDWRA
jgi:NADH-quinone oxidoreductase subunit A